MKPPRISEDIIPVSEFKARTAEWLRRVAATNQPLVITQNGKPAGVLLSPGAFDLLVEQARFVASVEQGLADSEAGRVTDQAKVAAEMKTRYQTRRGR